VAKDVIKDVKRRGISRVDKVAVKYNRCIPMREKQRDLAAKQRRG
jgi:hypothetical protein